MLETLVKVVFLAVEDLRLWQWPKVKWEKSVEDKGEKVESQRRVFVYVRDSRTRL